MPWREGTALTSAPGCPCAEEEQADRPWVQGEHARACLSPLQFAEELCAINSLWACSCFLCHPASVPSVPFDPLGIVPTPLLDAAQA